MDALARKLWLAFLATVFALPACARTQPMASPSPVAARPVVTPQAASASDAAQNAVDTSAVEISGPDVRPPPGRAYFFNLNGYRHEYTPRSTFEFGLVVIGSTDELSKARRLARKARAALGLPYADLAYRPDFGFVYPRASCVEVPYPCGPEPRYTQRPLAYLSIDHGGAFENLDVKSSW